MITGWLVKLLIGIAILGIAAVEVGSPIITRAQVDGAAHDAADDAAAELFSSKSVEKAQEVAKAVADKKGAELQEFTVDEQGRVHVRLFKQAKSFVLKKLSQTKSWYEIRVSATGNAPTNQ